VFVLGAPLYVFVLGALVYRDVFVLGAPLSRDLPDQEERGVQPVPRAVSLLHCGPHDPSSPQHPG
jgi:hypothetical protein